MSDALDALWRYPLFEALYGRRSRRFARGFAITEGPLAHASAAMPLALSETEEAVLVAAGAGVSGTPLWDMGPGRWSFAPARATRFPAPRAAGARRCSSPTTPART